MSEKKYYWLKLKEDFFKRHDIKIIGAMDNGTDYVMLYLKLLVESISHNGRLRFSEEKPYTEKMLATITDTNIDIVRSALAVFRELGLMKVLDDQTLYMTEVVKMTGSESASTQRSRKCREKKALQCNVDATPSNEVQQNCNTERELELDKELDKEPEPEREREVGAGAPIPSLPPQSERQRLVEKFGEANVAKYELKFKAWQQKDPGRSSLDKLVWIERWLIEDGVSKPKNRSSIDTDRLMARIMENYRKGVI